MEWIRTNGHGTLNGMDQWTRPPDRNQHRIATAYGLQRQEPALLNVSAIRDESDDGYLVRVTIRAVARTLYGQIRPVELREIVEDKAIYYIADFRSRIARQLMFDPEIMPEGGRYSAARAHAPGIFHQLRFAQWRPDCAYRKLGGQAVAKAALCSEWVQRPRIEQQ